MYENIIVPQKTIRGAHDVKVTRQCLCDLNTKVKGQIIYILRVKSLAIYFGDSQFRINRTSDFMVSKYMLANIHECDDINRLKFHKM